MAEHKSPKVTTDAVIIKDGRIVLIKRLNPPYQGMWALPGGFVDYGEQVEDACVREALEETSLNVTVKRLVGVYSSPTRDPRGHTVGVAYLCDIKGGQLRASDDAQEAGWFRLDEMPQLAFDHGLIVEDAKMIIGRNG